MDRIGVFIVDDSIVFRSRIKAALSTSAALDILGTAPNGKVAVERLRVLRADLVILDLEMPEMDGLETLRRLSAEGVASKVIVFASRTRQGAVNAIEALRLGATDFVAKPDGT